MAYFNKIEELFNAGLWRRGIEDDCPIPIPDPWAPRFSGIRNDHQEIPGNKIEALGESFTDGVPDDRFLFSRICRDAIEDVASLLDLFDQTGLDPGLQVRIQGGDRDAVPLVELLTDLPESGPLALDKNGENLTAFVVSLGK